jgi:hypothetical protein
MWVFLTDAFLSIVTDRDNPKNLLVRARFAGDIEAVFPFVKAERTEGDYPYQKSVERDVVAAALSQRLRALDYDSLREAVQEDERHETYFQVWSTLRKRARS